MSSDSNQPVNPTTPPTGGVPLPFPSSPPTVSSAPPPLLSDSGPALGQGRPPRNSSGRQLLILLLSLCLGLFLADAIVSFADDSLILLFDVRLLAGLRAIVFLFTLFFVIVVYSLMGITPMIPKRVFLPLTLFIPVTLIVSIPLVIYFYSRIQQVAWMISLLQVLVGLFILRQVQRGWKLRWPLIADNQLGNRVFSWMNLSGFLLANLLVALPVAVASLVLGTSLAVHHFSGGFVALRPGGLTVQVREYVRDDGKSILLVPMSHIGESDFYRDLSQSFPTNALILMEGVTDSQNLLTNKISYKRAAKSLGLVEQHEEFNPVSLEMIRADVDVEEFTSDTIDFMNLVMLSHSQGLTPDVIMTYMKYSPPPGFEQALFADLLGKRNRRLLDELHEQLPDSDHFIIPWGAAHMPEIAREIQEAGFRLGDTREHVAIRFGGGGNP